MGECCLSEWEIWVALGIFPAFFLFIAFMCWLDFRKERKERERNPNKMLLHLKRKDLQRQKENE